MRIVKKGDIKKIKVEHNRVLFWIIVALFLMLIFVVCTLIKFEKQEPECVVNSECVAASCCHASSCVALENVPNCSGVKCTQECVPETLDCGQGSCKCYKGKCSAIFE